MCRSPSPPSPRDDPHNLSPQCPPLPRTPYHVRSYLWYSPSTRTRVPSLGQTLLIQFGPCQNLTPRRVASLVSLSARYPHPLGRVQDEWPRTRRNQSARQHPRGYHNAVRPPARRRVPAATARIAGATYFGRGLSRPPPRASCRGKQACPRIPRGAHEGGGADE